MVWDPQIRVEDGTSDGLLLEAWEETEAERSRASPTITPAVGSEAWVGSPMSWFPVLHFSSTAAPSHSWNYFTRQAPQSPATSQLLPWGPRDADLSSGSQEGWGQ